MLNVWWLRLLGDIQILSGNISCLYVNELCNIHGTQDSEARSPHRVATCKLNVITFFRLAVACIKLCIQITIWPCMKFVTRKGFVTEMFIDFHWIPHGSEMINRNVCNSFTNGDYNYCTNILYVKGHLICSWRKERETSTALVLQAVCTPGPR